MEEFSLLRVRYHNHYGYKDSVVCTYEGKEEGKFYTYSYKYIYCPETKEWSHVPSPFSSKVPTESVTGMTENELVLFLKNKFEDKFEARSVFFDEVAAVLDDEDLKIAISKAEESNAGEKFLKLDAFDVKTGIKLFFIFGENGNLEEVRVQKAVDSPIEEAARFFSPFPESIEKLQMYLLEDSEYRMKLLLLEK